jgi:hypothetical protein
MTYFKPLSRLPSNPFVWKKSVQDSARVMDGLTALSTIAQNSRRIAIMDGDSGTREGSHVPDGILTSIVFGIQKVEVQTPCRETQAIYA